MWAGCQRASPRAAAGSPKPETFTPWRASVAAATVPTAARAGDAVANLVVDESLDDILLVSAHDHAAHVRVIWLGPEVPWVRGVAAVFEGNEGGPSS